MVRDGFFRKKDQSGPCSFAYALILPGSHGSVSKSMFGVGWVTGWVGSVGCVAHTDEMLTKAAAIFKTASSSTRLSAAAASKTDGVVRDGCGIMTLCGLVVVLAQLLEDDDDDDVERVEAVVDVAAAAVDGEVECGTVNSSLSSRCLLLFIRSSPSFVSRLFALFVVCEFVCISPASWPWGANESGPLLLLLLLLFTFAVSNIISAP